MLCMYLFKLNCRYCTNEAVWVFTLIYLQ